MASSREATSIVHDDRNDRGVEGGAIVPLVATERCVVDIWGGEVGASGPSLRSYVTLVDVSGRCLRAGKRGAILVEAAPILDRLGVPADRWLETMHGPGQMRGSALGGAASRAAEAARRGVQRVANCCRLFLDGRRVLT